MKSPTTDLQTLSVVVPAYNEQDVLPEFYRRTAAVLDGLDIDAEIVFVNDGSGDGTLALLDSLRERDARVAVVNLSRNFGKEIALTAGLDHARGDAVVVIDADLQDPPEIIPKMLTLWRQGNDVVYARRMARQGETLVKRATAHIFYRLMRSASRVQIPEDTGDFRLLSRRAVDALKRLREQHRFMKGLFAWIGYRQIALPYHRDPRFAGETKWNYWKLWNFAIEGFTSFTIMPLKVSTYVGLITALLAFFYAIYIVLKTLFFGEPVQGFPTLIVVILMLGGLQLMTLGVLGEYLGRMFNETKHRPLYLIDEYKSSQTSAAPPLNLTNG